MTFAPTNSLSSRNIAFHQDTACISGEWGRSLVLISIMATTISFLVILLPCTMVQSQLVGSRGVVKLKPGYEYRDKYTVSASEQVANFAKRFQPFDDNNAQGRRSRTIVLEEVEYQTATSLNKAGRKIADRQIFDFQSSREISPLAELRTNKPLQEVEIERSTSSTRLLPGETDTIATEKRGRISKTRGRVFNTNEIVYNTNEIVSKTNGRASKNNGRVFKTRKVSTNKRVPTIARQNTRRIIKRPAPISKKIPNTHYSTTPVIRYGGRYLVPAYTPGLLYSLVITRLG